MSQRILTNTKELVCRQFTPIPRTNTETPQPLLKDKIKNKNQLQSKQIS